MKAEIITIGTEILLGEIVNTNAQYLAQQCAEIGLDVYYQTVVGDNLQRLRAAFTLAATRAELIICTGGLGPTDDDLTKQALAEHVQRELQTDDQARAAIELFFTRRGLSASANNLRQAWTLTGADVLPNDNGLAVGTAVVDNGVAYLLLPGPPRELQQMFSTYAVPWIRRLAPELQTLHSHILCFAGIGESAVAAELDDFIKQQTDPTIATYAKEGEVQVRLASRTPSTFVHMEAQIRQRLGEYLYAVGEQTLEETVVAALTCAGKSVALAESCTGGTISKLLTSVPGSSNVFEGAMVVYSNRVKHNWLHIPHAWLEGGDAPGAVSRETAVRLAEQMLIQSTADYSLAVTGVAGPAEQENKPVGLVYIAIGTRNGVTTCEELRTGGTRTVIQWRAAKFALYKLWQKIK